MEEPTPSPSPPPASLTLASSPAPTTPRPTAGAPFNPSAVSGSVAATRLRVQKALELTTDTPEFLDALDTLASAVSLGELRQDPRRHLREALEKKALLLASLFDEEAKKLEASISDVHRVVREIDGECDRVLGELTRAETMTTKFLNESSELRAKRKDAEDRAASLSLFLQKFQLTQEHKVNLELGPEGAARNGLAFFDALDRVGKVCDERVELLTGSNQDAGFEIFDVMMSNRSKALERIESWFRRLAEDSGSDWTVLESEETRELLMRGFAHLARGSQSSYEACALVLARARTLQVAAKFQESAEGVWEADLAQGVQLRRDEGAVVVESVTAGSTEALRYLSDLLMALHKVIAEENDFLRSVCRTEEPARPPVEEGEPAPPAVSLSREATTKLVHVATEGTAEPLRVRAQTVISAIRDPVSAYRAIQILAFYSETAFRGGGGAGEVVLDALKECGETAKLCFHRVVDRRAAEALESARARALPGADLSASIETLEFVKSLRDVLAWMKEWNATGPRAALGESTQARDDALAPFVAAFVNPVKSLVGLFDRFESNAGDNACIFAVNNLSAVQAVLSQHDFTASFVTSLATEIGERLDRLALIHSQELLIRSGMAKVGHALLEAPAPESADLDVASVRNALSHFYRELSGSLVMPEFDRIEAPRLRNQARSATCSLILAAHNQIYDALAQREDLKDLLVHSKESVAAILDV